MQDGQVPNWPAGRLFHQEPHIMTQTQMSETDTLVIRATVALLEALELADGELSVRDVNFAIGHVLDWMYDMGQEYSGNADEGSLLFGQVCREVGIDL